MKSSDFLASVFVILSLFLSITNIHAKEINDPLAAYTTAHTADGRWEP